MSVILRSCVALGLLCSVASAAGQPAPGPGRMGPGAAGGVRGTGGVGLNAKNAAQQLEAIRTQLAVDDEAQWKALSPKIEKAIKAKQGMNTGAGMNWTASSNAKATFQPSTATPGTAPGKAMQEVRDAVANPDASKDELAGKVAAVRKARQKARADHEAAQEELSKALTPRQEAILMTLGVVE